MRTDRQISIKIVGKKSGDTFKGEFTLKGSLTRRDMFRADAIRREIIGPSPENGEAAPSLQSEAFVTGQVGVRILKGPTWWETSDMGQNLEDPNIIFALYDDILKDEEDQLKEIEGEADSAKEVLKEKHKKEGLIDEEDV